MVEYSTRYEYSRYMQNHWIPNTSKILNSDESLEVRGGKMQDFTISNYTGYVLLWEEFINILEENTAAIHGIKHEQFWLLISSKDI